MLGKHDIRIFQSHGLQRQGKDETDFVNR
jgi:hypothetical protein